MALIVPYQSVRIAAAVLARFGRGANRLEGRGASVGCTEEVLLPAINNFQLKRLEELVFRIDAQAFVIL